MKRLLATLALTCALSGVSLGADIPTCGLTANEPTPAGYSAADDISQIPASEQMATGVNLSILLTLLDLAF